jgi:WD40 repeat protein
MSSAGVLGVSWLETDRVAVFLSDELRLYSLRPVERLHATNTQVSGATCVEWLPGRTLPSEERLLAVGRSTGQVVVTSFARVSVVACEMVPKTTRQCKDLSWNAVQPAWLAAGYERDRRDAGVYVWEVEGGHAASSNAMGVAHKTPLTVLGAAGEGCASLAWEPQSVYSLAVGTHSKFLRLYDTRTPGLATQSVLAHLKAVNGVRFSPANQQHLLTYSMGKEIKLWDIRLLRSGAPILHMSMPSGGPVSVAKWSSNGSFVAACSADSARVSVWNVATGCGGVSAEARHAAHGLDGLSGFASLFAPPSAGVGQQLPEGSNGSDSEPPERSVLSAVSEVNTEVQFVAAAVLACCCCSPGTTCCYC